MGSVLVLVLGASAAEGPREAVDRARAFEAMGDWERAAAAYEEAVALGAPSGLLVTAGCFREATGDWERAVVDYRGVRSERFDSVCAPILPDRAAVRDSAANLLAAHGRREEAADVYRECLDTLDCRLRWGLLQPELPTEMWRRSLADSQTEAAAEMRFWLVEPEYQAFLAMKGEAGEEALAGIEAAYAPVVAMGGPWAVVALDRMGRAHEDAVWTIVDRLPSMKEVEPLKAAFLAHVDAAAARYRAALEIAWELRLEGESVRHALAGLDMREPDAGVAAHEVTPKSEFLGAGAPAIGMLPALEAIARNEGDSDAWNALGVALVEQGKRAEAVVSFERAVALDPDGREANLNLGFMAIERGDFARARGHFEVVTQRHSEDDDAWKGLAVALRGVGDLDGAERIYDRALARHPEAFDWAINAAVFQDHYRGDRDAAQALLDGCLALNGVGPDDWTRPKIEPRDPLWDRSHWERSAPRWEEQLRERQEAFARLLADVAEMKRRLPAASGCPSAVEMAQMVLEQVQPVIDLRDMASAVDFQDFVVQAKADLDACAAGR